MKLLFSGLLNQETHQQLAERKKLHVVELSPHRRYFPVKIASPLQSELRTERDMEPKEVNLTIFPSFT